MKSGKFDEELSRINDIVDDVSPNSLLLFNESFEINPSPQKNRRQEDRPLPPSVVFFQPYLLSACKPVCYETVPYCTAPAPSCGGGGASGAAPSSIRLCGPPGGGGGAACPSGEAGAWL